MANRTFKPYLTFYANLPLYVLVSYQELLWYILCRFNVSINFNGLLFLYTIQYFVKTVSKTIKDDVLSFACFYYFIVFSIFLSNWELRLIHNVWVELSTCVSLTINRLKCKMNVITYANLIRSCKTFLSIKNRNNSK